MNMEQHFSDSKQSDALEQNVSRLLQKSYHPEPFSGDLRQRLTQAMLEQAGRRSGSAMDGESLRHLALIERWRGAVRGAIAAALVMGAGFAMFWNMQKSEVVPPVENPAVAVAEVPATVGFIRLAVEARWDRLLRMGDRMPTGRVRLLEGVAQIVFDRGAMINLAAPCELDIRSDEHCMLLAGRLTADVAPDAVGFIIDTPQKRLIDRGTRFGVSVSDNRVTEVHVFEGQVDLAAMKSRDVEKSLKTGQAMRIRPGGQERPFSSDPAGFIHGPDVAARFEAAQRGSHERWLSDRTVWMKDPALRVYMDFAPGSDLENAAGSTPHANLLGLSPRWGNGRWSSKQVLEFDGRSDHTRISDVPALNLSGDFTIAMWLRMDAVPYQGWTRIAGKGKGLKRNYGVWINPSRRLLWQVCPEEPFDWGKLNAYTQPLEPGRWYWFVGVVEGNENRAYLNGKLEQSAVDQKRPVASTDESFTIGHYYDDVPGHTGFFSGAIDELMVLARPLTEAQIREAWEAGNPEIREAKMLQK